MGSSDSQHRFLAETIQRAFPELKVVEALNTMTAALMLDPGSLANGEHDAYLCGNDEAAKQKVKWPWASLVGVSSIDFGDITNARWTEQLLPLWVRLYGALETANFRFKLVR